MTHILMEFLVIFFFNMKAFVLDTASLSRHLKTISKKKNFPTPTEILLMEEDKIPLFVLRFCIIYEQITNHRGRGQQIEMKACYRNTR